MISERFVQADYYTSYRELKYEYTYDLGNIREHILETKALKFFFRIEFILLIIYVIISGICGAGSDTLSFIDVTTNRWGLFTFIIISFIINLFVSKSPYLCYFNDIFNKVAEDRGLKIGSDLHLLENDSWYGIGSPHEEIDSIIENTVRWEKISRLHGAKELSNFLSTINRFWKAENLLDRGDLVYLRYAIVKTEKWDNFILMLQKDSKNVK